MDDLAFTAPQIELSERPSARELEAEGLRVGRLYGEWATRAVAWLSTQGHWPAQERDRMAVAIVDGAMADLRGNQADVGRAVALSADQSEMFGRSLRRGFGNALTVRGLLASAIGTGA